MQVDVSIRSIHADNPAVFPTITPSSQANNHKPTTRDSNLACRLDAYVKILERLDRERTRSHLEGANKQRPVGLQSQLARQEPSNSNRLIFLVPMLVIYWAHHNPHGHSQLQSEFESMFNAATGYDTHRRLAIERLLKRIDREASTKCHGSPAGTSSVSVDQVSDETRRAGSRELRNWISAIMRPRGTDQAKPSPSASPSVAPSSTQPTATTNKPRISTDEPQAQSTNPSTTGSPVEELYSDVISSFSSILSELDESTSGKPSTPSQQ